MDFKSRASRTSRTQLNMLVKFMGRHGDLSKYRGTKSYKLWKELTTLLNSTKWEKKSITDWKKIWASWKFRIKLKALHFLEKGPSACNGAFTIFELRVLKVLGMCQVLGDIDSDSEDSRSLLLYVGGDKTVEELSELHFSSIQSLADTTKLTPIASTPVDPSTSIPSTNVVGDNKVQKPASSPEPVVDPTKPVASTPIDASTTSSSNVGYMEIEEQLAPDSSSELLGDTFIASTQIDTSTTAINVGYMEIEEQLAPHSSLKPFADTFELITSTPIDTNTSISSTNLGNKNIQKTARNSSPNQIVNPTIHKTSTSVDTNISIPSTTVVSNKRVQKPTVSKSSPKLLGNPTTPKSKPIDITTTHFKNIGIKKLRKPASESSKTLIDMSQRIAYPPIDTEPSTKRRKLPQTSFDNLAEEFNKRRLYLVEKRERNYERIDLERFRLETKRLQTDEDLGKALNRLAGTLDRLEEIFSKMDSHTTEVVYLNSY